ncbi:MAG: hypothetical protein ACT4P6_07110 [Gemmatimonadaceae bacterium]
MAPAQTFGESPAVQPTTNAEHRVCRSLPLIGWCTGAQLSRSRPALGVHRLPRASVLQTQHNDKEQEQGGDLRDSAHPQADEDRPQAADSCRKTRPAGRACVGSPVGTWDPPFLPQA